MKLNTLIQYKDKRTKTIYEIIEIYDVGVLIYNYNLQMEFFIDSNSLKQDFVEVI